MLNCTPGLLWLKNTNFWLPAILLLLAACGGPPPESKPVDKKFRTTPPSRIYFKNIRSSAYQWAQDPVSRTDYYLLRKIANSDPLPVLYPTIADIWMEDQAQILFKSPDHIVLPQPVLVHWESSDSSGVYRMDSLSADAQYQLALGIYESVRKAHQIEISFGDEARMPLFRDAEEKNHYLISLQDYLRLTEYF